MSLQHALGYALLTVAIPTMLWLLWAWSGMDTWMHVPRTSRLWPPGPPAPPVPTGLRQGATHMEHVILAATERDGLVYQLATPVLDPASFDGGAETIQQAPVVIVRKALPDAQRT